MASPVHNNILMMMTLTTLITTIPHLASSSPSLDPNGYLLYCPCMGRLGNQVDHLLGSLAFAKKLNRTLVVPPFIAYNYHRDNNYVEYGEWFDTDTLRRYHRVVPMRSFMSDLAPSVWPPGKRVVYCHQVAARRSKDQKSCPAKDGSPFGPFWDHFGVTFDESKFLQLSYHSSAAQWREAFPTEDNLVMAFMGAMASYPVQEAHRHVQGFLEWSEPVRKRRDDLIGRKLERPYLAIHLRNGMDWKRACQHVDEVDGLDYHFMSSPQCTGYHTKRKFTREMCLPTEDTVTKHVLRLAQKQNIKSLFVATDSDPMLGQFRRLFREHEVDVEVVEMGDRAEVELDLAVMIEADEFIGSCASSISAFVVRKRLTMGKTNHFFGMDADSIQHTEL